MTIEGLEWSVATAVMPGETESGDRHVVCPLSDGILVAVIDGLGHGVKAAAAARLAASVLEKHAGDPVTALLERCHDSLRSTRGVALSVATISARSSIMTWAGVGNVEGLLRRAHLGLPDEKLLLRNGVLGSHVPPLQASVITLQREDLLIFTTDGVAQDVAQTLPVRGTLQAIATAALARGNKGIDDALLLLVRYRGGES
ncbi:MAG: SpoIIE family protein phosphatase [Steroidobacteraceae bacterium]